MRTEEIKIYQFDELSDEAKEKAREWWRTSSQQDKWWDFCYEDAKTIAALFGLEIENIYFSGFWSQGDGACFEGSYQYQKGGLKAVKDHAPQDTDLHEIVQELQDIQRKAFYQLSATTKQQGHYSHSGCMRVEVMDERGGLSSDYVDVFGEQEITDQLRYFADWIYKRLEDEYDWRNSDEQVDESITINEYEFTEDGEIY